MYGEPTIERKARDWYEITSAVRRYIVREISGGWIIVGALLDTTEKFGQNYGGRKTLNEALDTAWDLAAHDNKMENEALAKVFAGEGL